MKLILSTVVLACFTALLSCESRMKGYVKYQTFDEYTLEGISKSNIKYPYVLVKKTSDTIFVIKSNDRINVMKYVNKGDFWFYHETEKRKGRMIKVPFKKFIIKDTIFSFNYTTTLKGVIQSYAIGISTKEKRIQINNCKIIFDNEYNVYKKIRNVLSDYNEGNIPYCDDEGIKCPNGCHTTDTKVFKDDLLYLYDCNGTKNFVSIYKLNRLGEFDMENAQGIMYRNN